MSADTSVCDAWWIWNKTVHTKVAGSTNMSVADDWVNNVKLGVAAKSRELDLGVSYGASYGDVRKLSHDISFNATYRF